MELVWNDRGTYHNTMETIKVRKTTVWPSNLRVGDYLECDNVLCTIVTMQKDCESITLGAPRFVSIVLKDEEGCLHFDRPLDKVSVMRPF